MAVEKGRATKPKKKPAVKAQAQKKPTPVSVPLSTGDTAVDAILARIHQMAGPMPSFGAVDDADPGLPADYNAKGGDKERKKFLAEKSGGLNLPKASDFHKLLDIAMRPGQALKTGIRYENEQDDGAFNINPGAFAKGAIAGFTGKDVTTGKQVLGREKGFGAGTAGFLADIILDPINLLPGAGLGKVLNKVDDTVLGAAKITTPAAKKRARNAAADVARDTAPATAAATAARVTDTPSPALTPLGTTREILEEETRLAKRAGQIQPKTAGDDLFGAGEMKATLPTVKPIPKAPVVKPQPVSIPVATAATMPAPKALGIDDLDDTIRASTFEEAQKKIGAAFDTDELSAKLSSTFNGPYGARLTWEQVSSNPAIRERVIKTPGFKALWGKVLNDERIAAASQINATRMAEYHAAVKSIEEAAQKAAPDVAAQLDEITPQVLPGGKVAAPKPLSEVHVKAAGEAATLHLRNHGDKALTSLGQAKLLQTVITKYFTAVPGAAKRSKTPNVQKTIRRLYAEAEEALLSTTGLAPTGALLSKNWDRIPKGSLFDTPKIASILDSDDVVSVAKEIASDLPKGVQASFVKSILEGLKVSGNAADVAQAKYMGKPELVFRTTEAVFDDLGAKVPPIQYEKLLKSSTEYESIFAALGNAGKALDKMFLTVTNKTEWEKNAIRMGEGGTNTAIEQNVQRLRMLSHGTDPDGFDTAFEYAKQGSTDELAAKVASYMEDLKTVMTDMGVSQNDFIQKLKGVPDFKDIDITLGFDAWKSLSTGSGKRHAAQQMALYADAAHNAALNSAVVGQLGVFFGAVTKKHSDSVIALAKNKGYVRVQGAPDDVLFPPDLAPRIKELLAMTGPQGRKTTNEFLKMYDKGLSLYKVGLTKYLPSHHITNHIGGMYMAWLDGMNNPAWLKRSWDVMRNQDASATGVAEGTVKGSLKTASGKTIPYPEVMRIFNESGLRPSFAGVADLASESAELKIKNNVATAVDRASQAREVHIRLSHFMFALSQEKGTLADAVQAATMRVQKHHGDYGDLTDFERRVMRRAIPFYTWQRKVVPTLIRQAASNPAKIMVYPKLQQSINSHFGIDPEPGNPFPGGELTPSFMTEGIQAKYGTRENGNEIWGAPRTPFDDAIGRAVNHPVGNILEMLTPAIKAPYELRSGTAIGNSEIRTITDSRDKRDYVEQNTPLLNLLVRLTRFSPLHAITGDDPRTQDGEDEQGTNIPALINLLTGANLRENTQRMQTIAEREQANG